MPTTIEEARLSAAAGIFRNLGIAEPEARARLWLACLQAEKDNEVLTYDATTGRWFTGTDLMDQLEAEGHQRLGEEFSRRRGYTAAQIREFGSMLAIFDEALRAGAAEDDLASVDAVLAGVFDEEILQGVAAVEAAMLDGRK